MEEKILKDKIVDVVVDEYKKGKIQSVGDVEDFFRDLIQPLMQKLLDTELDNHLGYNKYEHKDKQTNYRNGYCNPKKVKTKYGEIEVKTPRDRKGTFNPIIIEKGQTKLEGFEEKCISLYAKGMSLRDIEATLKDLYKVNINKDDISRMISAINEEVDKWRKRQLMPLYTFAYADCLYVPIKDGIVSEKKAIYVIIGVDYLGCKDVLGLWTSPNESASFWTSVFEDLKKRGVKDILYMCSDGIAGFKGSLETVFPKTIAQRCVVHLARNLYKICPKKEANKIIQGFKRIYTAPSLEAAQEELKDFKIKFSKHINVIEKVEDDMQYLETLFELPYEIRQTIYTTNTVESVNSALRKVTKGKGAFPSEESVFKVLFLRIRDLKGKWTKTIKNWNVIQSQLIDIFEERYTQYLSI